MAQHRARAPPEGSSLVSDHSHTAKLTIYRSPVAVATEPTAVSSVVKSTSLRRKGREQLECPGGRAALGACGLGRAPATAVHAGVGMAGEATGSGLAEFLANHWRCVANLQRLKACSWQIEGGARGGGGDLRSWSPVQKDCGRLRKLCGITVMA